MEIHFPKYEKRKKKNKNTIQNNTHTTDIKSTTQKKIKSTGERMKRNERRKKNNRIHMN